MAFYSSTDSIILLNILLSVVKKINFLSMSLFSFLVTRAIIAVFGSVQLMCVLLFVMLFHCQFKGSDEGLFSLRFIGFIHLEKFLIADQEDIL